VAVEACAGAGKTWMLVSRILRALLEEGDSACEPHEILAITFTKKAAGEMRERLDQWLEEFAERSPKSWCATGDARRRTRCRIAAVPRLKGLYRRLLEGGRPVQFRTFHAWFAGLLRNAPLAVLRELGLPSNYELLEDDAEARGHTWRPFFEAVTADRTRWPTTTPSSPRTAARRRPRRWARRCPSASSSRWPMRKTPCSISARSTRRSKAWTSRPMRCAANRSAAAGSTAPPRSASESNKTPQKAAEAIIDVFGVGEPPAESLPAALAHLRKNFFVASEDRLTKNLQKFPAAQEAEAELQVLCAAQAQHAAWLYQQRMTRLTRLLIAAFADVKRAHGWVDMNDVEQAAQLLLGQSALSGWVQERLDARIAHLLIDEFQDTNPLQWQALYGWLSAYVGAGSSAPRVFIVGDPKQSIYRFPPRRAAGVHRREEVRARRPGRRAAQLRPHAPQRTRRGRAGQPAMLAAQDAGEFDGYRAHTTERSDEGELLKLPAIDRDALGDAVAHLPTTACCTGATASSRRACCPRNNCCRKNASRPRVGRAAHRRRHAAAADHGAGAPAQPPVRHAGRAAPAPHSRAAAREERAVRRARGAGHGRADRRAGVARARPVAGAGAQVAAVRHRRRGAGATGAAPARARRSAGSR
jgi:ATP-dependent helicase/nuclease subunit A